MDRDAEILLIRRSLAGDRAATGDLIRAHQGALFAYMLRMCKRTDLAEDVTQEALYKAIKNLPRYDSRWRFSTWLFTIARRLWMNMQERKAPSYDSDLIDTVPGSDNAWSVTTWATQSHDGSSNSRNHIDAAMNALPDVQREAVVLCHQLGWPLKLAAQLMGLPEGTIKSHLFRARATLRQELAVWYARERRDSQDSRDSGDSKNSQEDDAAATWKVASPAISSSGGSPSFKSQQPRIVTRNRPQDGGENEQ
jgi:RNA polymerase sigma-70 factor (ECF subfamily)